MFDFSHVTDKEIEEYSQSDFLLKEERCSYKVLESETYLSKSSGKQSIKLKLEAQDSTGKVAFVFCYLGAAKLVKFLVCQHMEEALQSKQVNPSSFVGLRGYFMNKWDTYEGEKKNSVYYFTNTDGKDKPKEAGKVNPPEGFDDQDLPF
jgi:hypothetical protein